MRQQRREPYSRMEMNVLLAASFAGNLPDLERLLHDDKDIDTRGSLLKDTTEDGAEQITTLQAAASRGHLEVIEYLIRKGADVNLPNDGETMLLAAAYRGQPQVVETLLKNGADISQRRFRDASALHEAVADVTSENLAGKAAVLEILLNYRADKEVIDEDGHNPLHCAAQCGYLEIVKILIDNGANVNARSNLGDNPLDRAASRGDLAILKLLLDSGAEVNNSAAEEGCNGLGQAARHGHTSTVAFLLDHGAKAISPRHRKSELLLAARSGTAATVSLLYTRGLVSQGPQSLFEAVMIDPLDVVKLLLEQGIDINVRDRNGRSVLHFAVLGKRFERSNTYGVLHPRLELLRYFLDNGVDAQAEDFSGQTARNLAAASYYTEAVDLLEPRTCCMLEVTP